MTLWLFFCFLAPVVWAISNVGDKYIFTKWIKYPLGALIAFAFVGILGSAAIFIFKGFAHPGFATIFAVLFSGITYLFANLFYYKALQKEEVSRIIPLIYLEPLMTAVISAVVLGEVFSPVKYLGILLMVVGAVAISYKKSTGFKISKAVGFALFAALLYSITTVLTKYGVDRTDFWTVFAYARIGTFLGVLPILYFEAKAFKQLISIHPTGLLVIGLNNFSALLGSLFFAVAASMGYITLTTSLTAVQPFFVLVIILIVGIFDPHILEEENSRKIVGQKFLAMILMFLGILLIT